MTRTPHLDSYDDLDSVLTRAHDEGVDMILAIGIGDGPETMHQALAIAKSQAVGPRIFASVGIHPQEAAKATGEALEDLARIAQDPLCVAIGEIGLDYYHFDNPDVPTQKAAFVAQLKIASEIGKPILIHCRTSELAKPEAKAKYGDADAWEHLLDILADHWPVANGGDYALLLRQPGAGGAIDRGRVLSFVRREPDVPEVGRDSQGGDGRSG